MERTIEFTEKDLAGMRNYEAKTGQRIIMTLEEKYQTYKSHNKEALRGAESGIQNAIHARLNLDNDDCFDGEDDSWKIKVLEDNLEAIRWALREK